MSKGRILVVDDTAIYRTMLGDALTARGYDVIYAANGLDAIQIIKEEIANIDMVMLDLLMPKMLGFDVLKKVRQMEGGEKLPVMVITGLFKGPDDIKQVRDLGAIGFMDKSIPMDQIVSRADNLIHPDWEKNIEHQVLAQLLVTYKVGEKPFSAYTHSIGPKGMYIHTTNFVPPGAEVKIRFRIDDAGETINISGKVSLVITEVTCSGKKKLPPGIEVDYTDISPSDLAEIEKFVKRNALKSVADPSEAEACDSEQS